MVRSPRDNGLFQGLALRRGCSKRLFEEVEVFVCRHLALILKHVHKLLGKGLTEFGLLDEAGQFRSLEELSPNLCLDLEVIEELTTMSWHTSLSSGRGDINKVDTISFSNVAKVLKFGIDHLDDLEDGPLTQSQIFKRILDVIGVFEDTFEPFLFLETVEQRLRIKVLRERLMILTFQARVR